MPTRSGRRPRKESRFQRDPANRSPMTRLHPPRPCCQSGHKGTNIRTAVTRDGNEEYNQPGHRAKSDVAENQFTGRRGSGHRHGGCQRTDGVPGRQSPMNSIRHEVNSCRTWLENFVVSSAQSSASPSSSCPYSPTRLASTTVALDFWQSSNRRSSLSPMGHGSTADDSSAWLGRSSKLTPGGRGLVPWPRHCSPCLSQTPLSSSGGLRSKRPGRR